MARVRFFQASEFAGLPPTAWRPEVCRPRNVFVFGAGVSAGAGFPLGRQLQVEMERRLPKPHDETWRALKDAGLVRDDADLELNLTRLDLEIRERASTGNEVIETPGGPVVLWPLRFAVFRAIQELFLEIHARVGNRADYLRDFLARHVQRGDVIVTFNYDCLAENLLRNPGLWSLRDGYGLDLAGTYQDLEKEGGSPCVVLKLHGSIGWLSTVPIEGNQLVIEPEILPILGYPPTLKRRSWSSPKGVETPAVLPSYVKQLATFPLPMIWRLAASLIRLARRVVIIGYSFPAPDSQSRLLLAASLRVRQRLTQVVYAQDELRDAGGLEREFLSAGIRLPHVRSCVEHLATVADLWPERRTDLFCGHRH